MLGKRQLKGSFSLMLCILIPCICFFFAAAIHLAGIRIQQSDRARALYSGAELCLAQYDRKLWQEFALWGFTPQDNSLESVEAILKEDRGHLSCTAESPLFGSGEVERQILRQMRMRAALMLSRDFFVKMKSSIPEREKGSMPLLTEVKRLHQQLAADNCYEAGKDSIRQLMADESAGDFTEKEAPTAERPESHFSDMSEEEEATLKSMLRYFGKRMLPVYEAVGNLEVSPEDAFSPSHLENLAASLDQMLDRGIGLDKGQLLMAEYALAYFPSRVFIEKHRDGRVELTAADGRSMRELAKKRAMEVEILASGIQNKELASLSCDAYIIGLRFLPRYLAAFKDPGLQARYQKWSRWLSVSLRILSLGEIDIPPELLIYFVQAADSLYRAQGDLQALLKGEGLDFWPPYAQHSLNAYSGFRFYYRDYIRLILWSRPVHALSSEIETLIRKQYPGEYFTEARLVWEVNGKTYEVSRAYRDAEKALEGQP